MSTMMSSRRTYVSARRDTAAKTSGNGMALLALIGGVIFMALGLHLDVAAVFGVGSVAFACAFMYLNAMFWAKRMDKINYRPSEFRKYDHY